MGSQVLKDDYLKCTPVSAEVVADNKKKSFPSLELIDTYNELACTDSRAFVMRSMFIMCQSLIKVRVILGAISYVSGNPILCLETS